jgi:hypothetical protein
VTRWLRRLARDAADHERALELASTRMDEVLPAGESAWLEAHLDRCDACRRVIGEYEVQRSALRALFAQRPEPPRDLWARTAAAMDASRPAAAPRSRLAGSVSLAPVAGLLVIAIAVGAGLFNGTLLLPSVGGTSNSDAADATPIALAAGELQVVSRDGDGRVEIRSRSLDEVCPLDAGSCGIPTNLDVTQSTTLSGSSELDAIISPDRDRLVVVERGDGPQSVYVLPVSETAAGGAGTPSPSPAPATPPLASPESPRSTMRAATGTPPVEEPPTTSEPQPSAAPGRSSAPSSTDGPPTSAPTPSDEAGPTRAPEATAEPSSAPPPASETPPRTPGDTETPVTPGVAVTPGPGGALEIAHDVTIVGSAAYSADGTRFAFSARPAGGSIGPDVYVWQVGASMATAVTSDHGSVFSGWLGNKLLISRVVNGSTVTLLISPNSGMVQQIGVRPMWRPTVAPGGELAVWWDGTVTRAADGLTWTPDAGRLILAAWPDGGNRVQVLATGPLTDWDVHWDETGTTLAVWVTAGRTGSVGQLSLYAIDPDTGLPDLAHPMLAGAPAYAGFSLRAGRLAWSAPDAGGDTSVEVLAWDGATVGRLALPTINGSTVVR